MTGIITVNSCSAKNISNLYLQVCSRSRDLENLNILEMARAKTRAMRLLVGKRGLWEPHHTHYSRHYGDKAGKQYFREQY